MKVERRNDTVFISHDGVTIFFNALRDGSYMVRVTRRDSSAVGDQWHTVGEMAVDGSSMDRFVGMLMDLLGIPVTA